LLIGWNQRRGLKGRKRYRIMMTTEAQESRRLVNAEELWQNLATVLSKVSKVS